MTTQNVPHDTDGDLWRTATWLMPVVFQLALAVLAAVAWLAGKFAATSHFLSLTSGTIVATVLVAAVGWCLLRVKTPASRARANSVFGCAAALLLTGIVASVVLETMWR